MGKRDEFSEGVKRIIARRVNYHCSMCGASTSGPHIDPEKYTNVGVASHITGAAKNGPRFDDSLSPEQRRHPDNGIWLCQTHGTLVDNDKSSFSVEYLKSLKRDTENKARLVIGAPALATPSKHLNLSHEEIEILINVPENEGIVVRSSDELPGDWIRAGARQFQDQSDPLVAAIYLEAFESLYERKLVRHIGDRAYVLTSSGIKFSRELKQHS